MSGRFRKKERLKSTKKIQSLFLKGHVLFRFPLRLVYGSEPLSKETVRVIEAGFSVPKKRIKKAVHRNRIKRRIREAYRLNKAELWEGSAFEGRSLSLMWIYTSEEELEFGIIERSVKELLGRLIKRVNSVEQN